MNEQIRKDFQKETGKTTLNPPEHDPGDRLQTIDILKITGAALLIAVLLYYLL